MISHRFRLLAALAALSFAGLVVVSAPVVAQPPDGHFRIGVLVFGVFRGPLWSAFVEELRKLGYVDGQNTTFEVREAESQQERLPVLAAELVALNPEVIFTSALPPIMALKKAGTSIPVVFTGIGDPVRLGVVESIPRPGGNFTGISNRGDEVVAKRLELLKELVPDIIRIAMFQNPLNPAVAITVVEEITKNAKILGMEMIAIEIRRGEDLPAAIEHAVQAGAQGLMITPDAITFNYRSTIIELLLQKRLPAVYPTPIEARDGGLIAYGADIEAQWRRAAMYVDKILHGAKPADLPVEQGTPILAINLKTAAALGIQVPWTLSQRADEMIE
jgi:putative ABC transport system substrate-binding protein